MRVDRHLGNLPSAILGRIVRKFMVLDDACRKWRQDETMTFPELSDCRAESGPTMQQFGDRRTFSDRRAEIRSTNGTSLSARTESIFGLSTNIEESRSAMWADICRPQSIVDSMLGHAGQLTKAMCAVDEAPPEPRHPKGVVGDGIRQHHRFS